MALGPHEEETRTHITLRHAVAVRARWHHRRQLEPVLFGIFENDSWLVRTVKKYTAKMQELQTEDEELRSIQMDCTGLHVVAVSHAGQALRALSPGAQAVHDKLWSADDDEYIYVPHVCIETVDLIYLSWSQLSFFSNSFRWDFFDEDAAAAYAYEIPVDDLELMLSPAVALADRHRSKVIKECLT